MQVGRTGAGHPGWCRSSGDRDKQRQTKLDVAGGRKTSKHRKRSRRGRNTVTSEDTDDLAKTGRLS